MRGLSQAEAKQKLQTFGYNEIEQNKPGLLKEILTRLISPISLMLLLAAGLSFGIGKFFDGYFIFFLLLLNFLISFLQKRKADHAVEELQQQLSVQVSVLRNNVWVIAPARELAPGDIIKLAIGDIIPADCELLAASNVTVNESALTGESLPKDKSVHDSVFSGSFITTGSAEAEVKATGKSTQFGQTLLLVEHSRKRSVLEQDILRISKFLSVLSLIAVVFLTVLFIGQHSPWRQWLLLDLSLVIAGIPVSLPTVMTLIIGIGVLELAKKQSIVRQMSALEDLANVDLLLSDKTGTLTQNKISVTEVVPFKQYSNDDVLSLAQLAATEDSKNPIDRAIVTKAREARVKAAAPVLSVIPGDSERKRSTATVQLRGISAAVTVGAPQVVQQLCTMELAEAEKSQQLIEDAARQGFRVLAVAVNSRAPKEENMAMVGLLLLSDTLWPDAKESVAFLRQNGIAVKMLTGDNRAIAERVGRDLGLNPAMADSGELKHMDWPHASQSWFDSRGIFAEIFPADKLRLVETGKKYHRVAVTGDGVNDLPAIKAADVGIAVSNAVDALKSAADIVLLAPGISVIRDAVVEARKIFARLYSYSMYRISESLRLIVTIAVLGFIYKTYPLDPVQLILLAFLNDVPIISLAFNRVKLASKPSKIPVGERFILSSMYGLVGVANSLILFFLLHNIWHIPWGQIETIYFLKLTVSGHMLLFVAHTNERWYKFFPSKQVVWATFSTQILASIIAFTGILMPAISLGWIAFVWAWALVWMQVSELVKYLVGRFVIALHSAGNA